MKAIEFESTASLGGQIAVPPEVASEIPLGEHIHVVVMWESDVDSSLRLAGRARFEAAYAPEDAIY